jgi:alcohol dehydrogenase class IV
MVSVLSSPARELKRSIRNPHFIARAVFLDPSLLWGLPQDVIAHSGMDALVQGIESFCSTKATCFTKWLSRTAIELISENLVSFYDDPENLDSAQSVLLGSYFAGLALSGARLGVVHGLAHPLGMDTGYRHGYLCAMCLPHALVFNRPSAPRLFRELDTMLGGSIDDCVMRMMDKMGVPSRLTKPMRRDPDEMVDEILASGSTASNPRSVSREDAHAFLQKVYPTCTSNNIEVAG